MMRRNPVLYEINTIVWLSDLSLQCGRRVRLDTVPAPEWDRLAGLGIDGIWLMGVWQRSPRGIEISGSHPGNLADFKAALPDFSPADNAGSPYCIRDYSVDERFGGDTALATAREELSRRGLALILDLVPNHTAHDHPWVAAHPEYYIRGTEKDLNEDPVTFTRVGEVVFACGKDPFYPAWQDVLQVNPYHPGYRRAIRSVLEKIARQCDGVRCDMAMLLLNEQVFRTWGERAGSIPQQEFWSEIIPPVKMSSPGFVFLAEAYWDTEWTLQQLDFDYCYDKRLYDRLAHGEAGQVRDHLAGDPEFQSKLVRFTENHDEPRLASEFPPGRREAATVITSTLPGVRLIHDGQAEGRKTRIPVFLRRRPLELPDARTAEFYGKLRNILKDPVFKEGTWDLCRCTGWSDNPTFRQLLAWQWTGTGRMLLIVVNFSPTAAQGRVRLSGTVLPASGMINLTDRFSNQVFQRECDELNRQGLFTDLPAWGFHILESGPANHEPV